MGKGEKPDDSPEATEEAAGPSITPQSKRGSKASRSEIKDTSAIKSSEFVEDIDIEIVGVGPVMQAPSGKTKGESQDYEQ